MLVTKKILFQNLMGIQFIRGDLHVINNLFLNAMTFFSNLLGVGSIFYEFNPILVDARMSSIQEISGNVSVIGCDRLCPSRYTVVGPSPNQAGCSNSTVQWYLYIVGPASIHDISVLENVATRVLVNLTNGDVCTNYACLSAVMKVESQ